MSPLAALLGAVDEDRRPAWFAAAIDRVLSAARVLDDARGPRDLDDRLAELLGAQLQLAVAGGRGLMFEWWLDELVERVIERAERGGSDAHPDRLLLHGLSAVVTIPREVLARARTGEDPAWLGAVSRLAATGEVRLLRDIYGTRFGVAAEYRFGPVDRHRDRHWYLFDIDASGIVDVVDAGTYDDVEDACGAWRRNVGEPDAIAHTVRDPTASLRCLIEITTGDGGVHGDETRAVMNNWFRTGARVNALAAALRTRGTRLPRSRSLVEGIDATVLTLPFSAWFRREHGVEPDAEAVEALAVEWMEGALPETWTSISPARIGYIRELMGDWMRDDDVTIGAVALLPEWVRWLAQEAALPDDRIEALLDAVRTPEPALLVRAGRPG